MPALVWATRKSDSYQEASSPAGFGTTAGCRVDVAYVYGLLVRFRVSCMKHPAMAVLLAVSSLSAASPDFFESKVRPLLAAKCYSCHADSEMGGLRLDSLERVLQGGTRGPAVIPGEPSSSLLLAAVRRTHDELKMPPTEVLSEPEVAVLEEWIADGAEWPATGGSVVAAAQISPEARDFWAFEAVRRPEASGGDPAKAIDGFVDEGLLKAGLEAAPPADKATLIRRLSFDLLGLPPTPEETAAFLADNSAEAYERLVDRLLSSPHYGERLARHWLDLARYADGQSAAYARHAASERLAVPGLGDQSVQTVIFRTTRFVVLQLAADLLPEAERGENLAALGFHALRDRDDDRVDVTGRTFLGLTIGCAQCHDHKFDPIPQTDFYAMQGVFSSTDDHRYPLAPAEEVEAYDAANKRVKEQKLGIDLFLEKERDQLIDVLMQRTADFLVASYRVAYRGANPQQVADEAGLDRETLDRWLAYLKARPHEHPYLDDWYALVDRGASLDEARQAASDFQQLLLSIHLEKRAVDDRNYVKLGGAEGVRTQRTLLNTNLEFIEPVRYYLWRDMTAPPAKKRGLPFVGGVYHYGPDQIERFLSGLWLHHLEAQKAELARLKQAVPPPYPFLHAYQDSKDPKDARLAIRGDRKNLGPAVPRRFLSVLSGDPPKPFQQGSGRLELARAIVSPENPLTARVFANRLWQWRFGRGIVTTPSNFGQLGERPTHPELLDWLASEFVDSGWSVKELDKTILMSDAYRRRSTVLAANFEADPDNRLLWRFNPVRAPRCRDVARCASGRVRPHRPLPWRTATRSGGRECATHVCTARWIGRIPTRVSGSVRFPGRQGPLAGAGRDGGSSAAPLLLEQSVLHPAVERPRQAAGRRCRERPRRPHPAGVSAAVQPPAGQC